MLMLCVCRQYSNEFKLETYLKVARLYLEDEDPVQAEAYINRASLLQAESTREDLQIHYKVKWTSRLPCFEVSEVSVTHVCNCRLFNVDSILYSLIKPCSSAENVTRSIQIFWLLRSDKISSQNERSAELCWNFDIATHLKDFAGKLMKIREMQSIANGTVNLKSQNYLTSLHLDLTVLL